MNRISEPLLVVFALVSASILHTCGTLRADEQSPTTQTSGQGERPAEEGERQRGNRCPFAPEADDDEPGPSPETATKPSPPEPRITIGRDTTFIEGPLTEDGYVDYLAALNQRLSEGVTPENNAAVLLWQLWGPQRIHAEVREEFFKQLGIDPLPVEGDYLVGHYEFTRPPGDDDGDDPDIDELRRERWREYELVLKAPWKRSDYPLYAAWLDASEKHLAIAVAATKRPRFCQPVLDGDAPLVTRALNSALFATQGFRTLAQYLSIRSMFRLGEGDVDGAWEDALAIHRLTRLIAQGPTMIESLTALAINGVACEQSEYVLRSADVTRDLARKMEANLRALPPMPSIADKYDLGERFLFLDYMTMLPRDGLRRFEDYVTPAPEDEVGAASRIGDELLTSLFDGLLVTQVDWDEPLRMGNQWYDRIVEAARKPTYAERQEALAQVEADLEALARRARNPTGVYLMATLKGQGLRKAVGQHLGTLLVSMSFPIPSRLSAVEDRELARVDALRIAVAIAGYKAEHGKSPDRLEDLAPAHIPELPLDRTTDEAFQYEKTDKGYSLYGGDVAMRMPKAE
jgi:hypothetical protein